MVADQQMPVFTSVPETVRHIQMEALRNTVVLADALRRRQAKIEQFIDVERLLVALPMASDDFALARARLRNAVRYYDGGEVGAAGYELRLIIHRLRKFDC